MTSRYFLVYSFMLIRSNNRRRHCLILETHCVAYRIVSVIETEIFIVLQGTVTKCVTIHLFDLTLCLYKPSSISTDMRSCTCVPICVSCALFTD